MKRYHVTTFGCQMNEHDSERMKGMLESLGYAEVTAAEDADVILFNTCSIREKADSRFVAHLQQAKGLKARDPERIIGV
ncbi:MAG: tRNA-2-methylthio-N6-dimethylallyladenosine synthase, partial [Solirubrobacteraceae bacterium]|nr:tRNA-2-methylthio-N6-dimethylallyladenosine synthase [Solirubrobacteraceae bacterium]